MSFEKMAILGASSGLGSAIAEEIEENNICERVFLASRNVAERKNASFSEQLIRQTDFSSTQKQEELTQELLDWQPTSLIYCAGGGPHGVFEKKQWKDHQWALEVSFLFPARLIHALIRQNPKIQVTAVGSDIVENTDNAMSSSYAAGKMALSSLIQSLNAQENSVRAEYDVRLFSPGYMDTALLPPNAPPRRTHDLLKPADMAKKLMQWLAEPKTHWKMSCPSSEKRL